MAIKRVVEREKCVEYVLDSSFNKTLESITAVDSDIWIKVNTSSIIKRECLTELKEDEVSLEDVAVDKFYAFNYKGCVGHIFDNTLLMNQDGGGVYIDYYKGEELESLASMVKAYMKNNTVYQFDNQLELYTWCVDNARLAHNMTERQVLEPIVKWVNYKKKEWRF